jgi:uncharacterized membrane protein
MSTRLVIGPNASMSATQAWAFMGLMSVVTLGIATCFALKGLWPILPFAGLELGALATGLWVSLRRNRYREVVSFEETWVRMEFGLVGQGAKAVVELPRMWTRISLESGPNRHSPTRLSLNYCGQRVEIGRCLTDEEREQLAARLRQLLRQGGRETPAQADVSAIL